MESKISFFNQTIFYKNLKTFSPLWLLYLGIILCKMPFAMWTEFAGVEQAINRGYTYDKDDILDKCISTLISTCSLEFHSLVVMVFAAVVGMALFNYLFNSKSANMMHSLPVTRGELYFTNLISGLLFLWVPQIITFICSVGVCLAYGCTMIWVLGKWLLSVMAIAFVMYSLVCFCTMFTGQIFALPIYYAIVNFLFMGIRLIGVMVTNNFTIGVYNLYFASAADWLSPAFYILSKVDILGNTDENGYYCSLDFYNTKVLGIYCLVAVIIYIVAFILYKKRDIECAGDCISFKIVEPLFRWGFACCGGYILAVMINEVISSIITVGSKISMLIIVVIISGVLFFASEMLLRKNFRVFHKKRIIECFAMLTFVILLFASAVNLGAYISKDAPEESDVLVSYVMLDYPVDFDYKTVRNLQKTIVDRFDELGYVNQNSSSASVTLGYKLKDGRTVERNYNLIVCDETVQLLSQITDAEKLPDNLKSYYLCDDVSILAGKGQYGEFWSDSYYDADADVQYSDINGENIDYIVEAICKDIEAGNLNYSDFPFMDNLMGMDSVGQEEMLTLTFEIDDISAYSDIYTRTYYKNFIDLYGNNNLTETDNDSRWGNTELSVERSKAKNNNKTRVTIRKTIYVDEDWVYTREVIQQIFEYQYGNDANDANDVNDTGIEENIDFGD